MSTRAAVPFSGGDWGGAGRPLLLLHGNPLTHVHWHLIAPRLAIWEAGTRDGLIVPRWAEEALARMRLAYKALGAADRLLVDRHEGGHVWSGKVAYPQLEKALG